MSKPFKLVRLTVKNGEYEHTALMIIKKSQSENKVAKNFYGDNEGELDSERNGYYFNNREIHVSVRSVILITKEEKETLGRLNVAFL